MVRLIVREVTMAIRKAKEIKLSRVVNKVTKFVCRDSLFVDLMKTVLDFAILFKEKYNEKLVAARIMEMRKDIIDFDILTGRSILTY